MTEGFKEKIGEQIDDLLSINKDRIELGYSVEKQMSMNLPYVTKLLEVQADLLKFKLSVFQTKEKGSVKS